MHPSPFPLGEEVLSVESLPNLQKGRGGWGGGLLDRISIFREGCWERGGIFFRWLVVVFGHVQIKVPLLANA